MLNFAAVILYIVTALLCAWTAIASVRARMPRLSAQFWIVLACVFVALAGIRLTGAEEMARGALRSLLRTEGEYVDRRAWQAPIVAFSIVAIAALTCFAALRFKRWASPATIVAGLALAAMGALVLMRLVSFHALDKLLYRGPHLNWIVDIGATWAVAGAAWFRRAEIGRARKSRRGGALR